MVELQETRLDAVFHALGDRTRRQMLRRLADGQHTVGELAEPFSMSLAAASKHIKSLESAGLITREVLGRTHVCRLNAGPLSAASDWLGYYERFWAVRLDRLEKLLRADRTGVPAESSARPRRTGSSPQPAKPTPRRKRGTR